MDDKFLDITYNNVAVIIWDRSLYNDWDNAGTFIIYYDTIISSQLFSKC